MKNAILILISILSTSGWAAGKEAICDEYLNLVLAKGQQNVPLTLITETLNTAYELGFTAAQKDKLLTGFTGAMENKASGADDINKMVYFACTTDLTAEDKAEARQIFKSLIGE